MKIPLLHQSCLNGHLDEVKEHLNDQNIDEIVDFYEEDCLDNEWTLIQIKKCTPLICAIENNHLTIVQYLCQHGANFYLLE